MLSEESVRGILIVYKKKTQNPYEMMGVSDFKNTMSDIYFWY